MPWTKIEPRFTVFSIFFPNFRPLQVLQPTTKCLLPRFPVGPVITMQRRPGFSHFFPLSAGTTSAWDKLNLTPANTLAERARISSLCPGTSWKSAMICVSLAPATDLPPPFFSTPATEGSRLNFLRVVALFLRLSPRLFAPEHCVCSFRDPGRLRDFEDASSTSQTLLRHTASRSTSTSSRQQPPFCSIASIPRVFRWGARPFSADFSSLWSRALARNINSRESGNSLLDLARREAYRSEINLRPQRGPARAVNTDCLVGLDARGSISDSGRKRFESRSSGIEPLRIQAISARVPRLRSLSDPRGSRSV